MVRRRCARAGLLLPRQADRLSGGLGMDGRMDGWTDGWMQDCWKLEELLLLLLLR